MPYINKLDKIIDLGKDLKEKFLKFLFIYKNLRLEISDLIESFYILLRISFRKLYKI